MIILKLNTSLVKELLDDRNIIIRSKLHHKFYWKLQTNIHNITSAEFLFKLDNELWGTLGNDFRIQLCLNLNNEL
jgi:hypothetical protein